MEDKKCCCGKDDCSFKQKHRNEKEYKDLIKRLNRIEGQIKGVKNMVEEERYCVDILTQVSAIQAALNGFSRELFTNHLKTCVVNEVREGNDEVIEELSKTLQKLMK